MLLTANNLAYYLFERGLLSAREVVDGDYMVVEATRRNRNFKVIKQDRSGLFLKQVQRRDAESFSAVQVEAYCYRLTNQDETFSALREIVPRFHLWDERRAVLITELLPGSEALSDYQLRTRNFPAEVATELGRAFGQYHREVRASNPTAPMQTMPAGSGASPVFPGRVPWILTLHNAAPNMLQEASGGNYQLLNLLKTYPEFGRTLDELAGSWKQETLIHGDIKWDNCVLVPSGKGENNGHDGMQLKLVDWELADWGDPCWDVAAIFSAFVGFWVQMLPLGPGEDVAEAIRRTEFPIEKMQPLIQSFWRAYKQEMEMSATAASEVLRRSVLMCGARTIQSAYEAAQKSPQLNATCLYLLQASMNILTQPDEAASELLGLTIHEA